MLVCVAAGIYEWKTGLISFASHVLGSDFPSQHLLDITFMYPALSGS